MSINTSVPATSSAPTEQPQQPALAAPVDGTAGHSNPAAQANPASAVLAALCAIARLHQVAADPATLAHQLVYRGLTTLEVLVIGLVAIVIFESGALWGDLSIHGGAGNDHVTAIFGLGKYEVDLGAGDDDAYLGYRNSEMAAYSLWAGFNVVSKNDTVIGGAGSDIIGYNDPPTPEASGNDVMHAGAGNDYASGGYGNDVIFCRDMVLKVFVPVKSINEEIYRSVV